MNEMSGDDYVRAVLLGDKVSPTNLMIRGNVIIEGANEQQKLVLEGLDLEKVQIFGHVRIRNVVFTGDLNLYGAIVNGDCLVIENVQVNGNFVLWGNFWTMRQHGYPFRIRNLSFTGEIQI
jgi:hypothetical protein